MKKQKSNIIVLNSKNRILIAGQEGMVGSAIFRLFKKKKLHIINCPRSSIDFTSQKQVNDWFKKNKPTAVINAAGKVGGILDNSRFQSEYIYTNLMIGFNLLEASRIFGIKKFINLGSACIYPKATSQPIKESYLLSSNLEPSNEGYALAKISVLKFCEYLKKQKRKHHFVTLQPANIYGIGDNFDLFSGHVIPSLTRKFFEAKKNNLKKIEIWGSGNVSREFLHVDDLAEAVYFCFKKKIKYSFANVAGPDSITIKKLAYKLKDISNFKGKLFFNNRYPDGVKKRKLSNKILKNYGWKSKITLDKGLRDYYYYFSKNFKELT